MDISKARKFNEKMGKVQKFSKGGMIRKIADRRYFDDGGSTTLSGPAQSTGGQLNTVNNNGLTGTVSNELGLNNQFQATAAPIQAGTNAAQLNNAYTGAQSGLTQQQNLANQVQPGTTQGLNTQAALTGQLEGVVNGTGPNAAQTALNQNTATNVANQAALMSGQRGAGANAGLIARQAAQQGAATQQQAVGQGATLQAQQAIAAQGQLANLASIQVGQGATAVQGVNNAQQNEQNILQGANTSANNANVAQQSNLNSVNAGVASGNQEQAGNVVSGIGSAASNLPVVGSLFAKGGEVGDHHCAGSACTDRAHYAHMMADGGPLSVTPASPVAQEGVGPWLNSGNDSSNGPSVAAAPNVPQLSNPFQKSSSSGGSPSPASPSSATSANNFGASPLSMPSLGSSSGLGSAPGAASLGGAGGAGSAADLAAVAAYKGGEMKGEHGHVAAFLSDGGPVKAMLSPGERYLDPSEVEAVVKEGKNPLKAGVKVPGKPKVKGDSLKNDIVPADLKEGGVVIPRHIMNKKSRDHAELFVRRAVHMRAPQKGAK
jgi:hypothetical protein